MHFRIICGLMLLLAYAVSSAQTVPEREMTFSAKQDGSVFADFSLEEGEAARIQFLDGAGKVLRPMSIKVEDHGDSYIAGRVSPGVVSTGVRLNFLPKRNPVSVPLFDLSGQDIMRMRLLVKANAGGDAATIAMSTETDITVVRQVGALAEEERRLAGEMVEILGGTFRMGDLRGEDTNELPVHSVTVSPFWIGKYEVTFSQWDGYVADICGGDSVCTTRRSPRDGGWGRGNRPVINVTWDEVQEFIVWLNAKTGGGYRLPSESEWEYAARAGSESLYTWGDEIGVNRANCDGCGSRWDLDRTAPVGSFPPNAWGLHDMHGNVREWVEDCWHSSYEVEDEGVLVLAPVDGSAWDNGSCELEGADFGSRVIRNGSWNSNPGTLRSAFRFREPEISRFVRLGFRLARDR